MAVLAPYPFAALIRRVFRELEHKQAIFDLPVRQCFLGDPARDLSVRFHGHRASSPFGPAAGPQSQLAQNILLSWLAGGRIIELKTVQINDRLAIPRPCIDMQTVGFNIEWSQELTLAESLEEYVKAAMLIRILEASGTLPFAPGFTDTVFDMSVGYDFQGITSEPVRAFIRGMLDASPLIERLRAEIPDEHRRYRDLDFPARISDTLTLSTFHGCPAGEIEQIIDWLLRDQGVHCIVKLNPMLLGRDETRWLVNEALGYEELRVPDRAFARELAWDEMTGLVERLGATAAARGLGFGVKFTNTLVVENHRGFFPPSEREMYLSGQPLHVLATRLVGRFRERFGDRYPISFSAGIDGHNFADAVALGLVPVTVCTDLLRTGGYARARRYFQRLIGRMERVGAPTIDQLVVRTAAAGDGAPAVPLSDARLRNTREYVARVLTEPRYHAAQNRKTPPKIGRHLQLFDCITCDKCVPVCPNDANFTFGFPRVDIPIVKVRRDGPAWVARTEGRLPIAEKHQIGNFVDFCNDCGNCDVFCPEDGGPYVFKPRFFGSRGPMERPGGARRLLPGAPRDGRSRARTVLRRGVQPRGLRRPGILRRARIRRELRRPGSGGHDGGRRRRGRGPDLFRNHEPPADGHLRALRDQLHQLSLMTPIEQTDADIARLAERYTPDMVQFLRDMIAIPSESADERAVVDRARAELEKAGFDEVRVDGLGNLLGRVGSGPTIVALDAHLDTVGVGDPTTWTRDPYRGELRDGIIYGRGAGDQEAGFAAAVHGARIAKELGLLDGCQLWVAGTVMEEDCDGLCWQYILREKVLQPDVVVITEPTNLGVYRGHRGRMEMEVRTQGRSAHGSAPERGVNAVYKMAAIIADVERLNATLADTADRMLGKGSVTISDIRATSPSLCAVADSCTIHLDRRLTRGETLESAIRQIEALESVAQAGAAVTVLDYARAAYTGLTYPTKKYYPTWFLDEDHPAVVAGVRAAGQALGRAPRVGHWGFSTNGIATCGMFGVPTIGFGPGDEIYAHTTEDQCPVDHLTAAARFYAAFPRTFVATAAGRNDRTGLRYPDMMMTDPSLRAKIDALAAIEPRLFNGDFLLTWQHGDAAIRFVLQAAEILQDLTRAGAPTRLFDRGLGLSIFRDKSTRTRYAFRSGCNLLGLSTEELDESTSQISHGETVRETATMVGFLTETIGIRDDMFLGEGHAFMTEVAESLEDSFRNGVLARRPAVVNLQSDLDHPTQSLADLRHLAETFGGLDALRGRKIAMTWAYSPSYGKPLSVPQGIVALMPRLGMEVVLAHPPGYELVDEPLDAARRFARESGGSFTVVDSMEEAFRDADIVYPKSWAPTDVMRERTRLLRGGHRELLADLERQALANNAKFKNWECDEAKMRLTRGGRALYMHCLPADVTGVNCEAGEVAKEVFERYRFDTYREAGYKPFVIAAMILGARLERPADALRRCLPPRP
jgi:putative selenate reductase